MKKSRKLYAALLSIVIAASLAIVVAVRADDGENNTFEARLNGLQQVPAVITTGHGTFNGTISPDGTSISYTLTYSGLTSEVHFAHIHIGQSRVNGGVVAFLCGGTGHPACPTSGTVTGTLTSANVTAQMPSQGVAAGDFQGLVTAIRAGVTYVNVHTTNFPAGEIRGQIDSQTSD